MTLHRLLSKHAWPLSVLDLASWPDLEWSLLSPAARDRYRRVKAAISRVVRDHSTVSAAAREWGIDASELDRALERCFEPADDGRIQGFRALRPYLRLKAYTRHPDTQGGTAGILQALLERFPRISEQLWQGYREGKSLRELHDTLLNEWLPAVGWPRHGYPYNTSSKGREGLRQYLRRLEAKLGGEQWVKQGCEEGKRVIVRPFQRVELDAHKCDAHFIVHIDGPEGLSRTLVLERIWLLVLIDVASRAALGYALCLNRQCGIPDVLEAVHNAIVPQPVRELIIPGLAYKPGAGLPNQLIQICAWQLLDLLALDNAMAHRSPRVHQILNERTQCVITLNRGGTPNDNPFVERFFGTLTAHGLKRTPSTTGSGPDDPRRKDSEGLAEHYEFSLGDVEQLLAVQIANYNVEVHGGIYTSPLEYLRTYYREVPAITRHVPLAEREGFSLKELWVEVTIRGSVDDEKRPYVQYEGARYRNDVLASSPEFIGRDLLFLVAVDDIRQVKAFWPDGRDFGVLHAQGRWALSRHSLKTRRLILQLVREHEVNIGYRDPVRAVIAYLEQKAKDAKWARNQLARIQEEMESRPPDPRPHDNPLPAQEDPLNRDDWISLRTPAYD